MRVLNAGTFAALAFAALAACSAGTGPTIDTKAGPDGTPTASGDPSGPAGESPGGIFGDLPLDPTDPPGGSSNQGSCLQCSGSYVCTNPATDTDTSRVTLLPAAGGGCDVNDDHYALLCNGDFVQIVNGKSTVVGHWSGNNGGFSVTATSNDYTVTSTCVPDNVDTTTGGDNDAG